MIWLDLRHPEDDKKTKGDFLPINHNSTCGHYQELPLGVHLKPRVDYSVNYKQKQSYIFEHKKD